MVAWCSVVVRQMPTTCGMTLLSLLRELLHGLVCVWFVQSFLLAAAHHRVIHTFALRWVRDGEHIPH